MCLLTTGQNVISNLLYKIQVYEAAGIDTVIQITCINEHVTINICILANRYFPLRTGTETMLCIKCVY